MQFLRIKTDLAAFIKLLERVRKLDDDIFIALEMNGYSAHSVGPRPRTRVGWPRESRHIDTCKFVYMRGISPDQTDARKTAEGEDSRFFKCIDFTFHANDL
jgi:hypothetical protein